MIDLRSDSVTRLTDAMRAFKLLNCKENVKLAQPTNQLARGIGSIDLWQQQDNEHMIAAPVCRRPLMHSKLLSAGCMLMLFAWNGSSVAQTPPIARSFSFLGFPTKILLSGADTAGQSALLDIRIPSNAGPPAHIHSREDEVYLIKSGTFQFLMDGMCLQAGPGTSVYMPKGHFHTFKNISKQTGEQLMFVYPAGIEQYFWEVHELGLKMPQDFQKLNELGNSKYGINSVPDHDFHAGTCQIVKAPK